MYQLITHTKITDSMRIPMKPNLSSGTWQGRDLHTTIVKNTTLCMYVSIYKLLAGNKSII